MKTGTIRHPKTLALAGYLSDAFEDIGQSVAIHVAVSLLEHLWDWTSQYSPDGDLARWPSHAIATGLSFTSRPDALVECLARAGWLDRSVGGGLLVHDWPQHCEGWVHAKLARRGETFADGTAPSTRFLKSTERPAAKARACESTIDMGQSTHKDVDNLNDIVWTCDTSKPGDPWKMDTGFLRTLETAYPAADVPLELKRMAAWLAANPSRRKTKRGMPRFVQSWLSRAGEKQAAPAEQATIDPEIAEWAKQRRKRA